MPQVGAVSAEDESAYHAHVHHHTPPREVREEVNTLWIVVGGPSCRRGRRSVQGVLLWQPLRRTQRSGRHGGGGSSCGVWASVRVRSGRQRSCGSQQKCGGSP